MITNLLDKLLKRGLITGIYPESTEFRERLRNILSNQTTVYTGFDATAPSLHVGNLATIINSLHFQAHGHQVICVIGDATAQIGDPSGHTHDRHILEKTVIENNASCIEQTLMRIFSNFNNFFTNNGLFTVSNVSHTISAPKEMILIRNSTWYADKTAIDFVGDVFRDVRVGKLLHKKFTRERIQAHEGMNVAEFCYPIFQAFDWMELWRRYGCQLQIGGSDQSGNIQAGHELVKKRHKSHESIGLLAPLITMKGKKLGKSIDKARSGIWLRPDQTSAFDLYQFFHRVPDENVEQYLKIFSFYDDNTINDLVKNHLRKSDDIWHCQRKLAEHACLLVHGQEGLDEAKRETEIRFHKSKKSIDNK